MKITLRQRLRYRFDNLMARGTGAQILMLGAATLGLTLLTGVVLLLAGAAPGDPDSGEKPSFGHLVWAGLMHLIDAGAVGGDSGSWTFLFIMLGATIGGIFVLSALIGILTGGFGDLIQSLRKGRSRVLERGHTLILGWSSKIPGLLTELAEAAANQPGAVVVILADRDKVAMDDEVREHLVGKRLRVVTRSGSPMSLDDLAIVSPGDARAIIVLAPEHAPGGEELTPHEADTVVLKVLLAIAKLHGAERGHVVAEVHGEKTMTVARMVAGEEAALVNAPSLISRLLVQTGRQSGLSVVYTELLSFSGDEIYVQAQPQLAGKSFREALSAYEDSTLIGVVTAAGEALMPPPLDRPMEAGDHVVAISRDDDTVVLNGKPTAVDEGAFSALRPHATIPAERTLVLGDSVRLHLVLAELDAYVTEGSETLVIGEDDTAPARVANARFQNMKVTYRHGDTTERALLDELEVARFDHILVLAETRGRSHEMADARTMITLLHLRDILARADAQVPITTEMMDGRNRELASIAEADDFIVSSALVSLVISQIAENKHLFKVFDELLDPEGHEFYLKPAGDYIKPGTEVDFYTVLESAARRGEVAIGYRQLAHAADASRSYGVVLNPPKSRRFTLAPRDRVIVLAEK